MATAKTEYKYLGHYAHTLANGRPVEPGEVVKLTNEEAKENQELVDSEVLVDVSKMAQPTKADLEEGKEG